MDSPEGPPPPPDPRRILAESGHVPGSSPRGELEKEPGGAGGWRSRLPLIAASAIALGLGVALAVIIASGPRKETVTRTTTSVKTTTPTTTTSVITTVPTYTTTTIKTTKTVTETQTSTVPVAPPGDQGKPGSGPKD